MSTLLRLASAATAAVALAACAAAPAIADPVGRWSSTYDWRAGDGYAGWEPAWSAGASVPSAITAIRPPPTEVASDVLSSVRTA